MPFKRRTFKRRRPSSFARRPRFRKFRRFGLRRRVGGRRGGRFGRRAGGHLPTFRIPYGLVRGASSAVFWLKASEWVGTVAGTATKISGVQGVAIPLNSLLSAATATQTTNVRAQTITAGDASNPFQTWTVISASAIQWPGSDFSLAAFRDYRVLRYKIQAKCILGNIATAATELRPMPRVFWGCLYSSGTTADPLTAFAQISGSDTDAVRWPKFEKFLLQPTVRHKMIGGYRNVNPIHKITYSGNAQSIFKDPQTRSSANWVGTTGTDGAVIAPADPANVPFACFGMTAVPDATNGVVIGAREYLIRMKYSYLVHGFERAGFSANF